MSVEVIEFYKKLDNENPFSSVLMNPVFYILVKHNEKIRELVLKLSGEYDYSLQEGLKDFEQCAYKDYFIIVKALLGENGELIRDSFRLDKKELRELIFGLYFTLVKNHSLCGWFKKQILVLLGLIKFYSGKASS